MSGRRGGRQCAVASCPNNQMTLKKSGITDVIFHCFPVARDLESSSIQEEWMRRCQKRDGFKFKNACVCSDHFTKNDYERDLENELLGLPLRRKLKKTAVPTKNLRKTINVKTTLKEMAQQEELFQISSSEDPLASTSGLNVEIVPNVFEAPPELHATTLSFPPLDNQQRIPLTDSPSLEEKYSHLLKKYTAVKQLSLERLKKIQKLNRSMIYYRRKYYNENTAKPKSAEKLLQTILTKNQIRLLSGSKEKVVWTRDEISVAFTIRCYSEKCYLYLRDKLKYPLPSLSSLRRWASKWDLSQGILNDVLMIKKLEGEDLTDFDETVVLEFDEGKVRSLEQYDIAKDHNYHFLNQ